MYLMYSIYDIAALSMRPAGLWMCAVLAPCKKGAKAFLYWGIRKLIGQRFADCVIVEAQFVRPERLYLIVSE